MVENYYQGYNPLILFLAQGLLYSRVAGPVAGRLLPNK